MASLTERVRSVKAWGRAKVDQWRVRRLWLDHLIRALRRYQAQSGDLLAGAVTYFAFLSFFPLVALSYAVLGFVVATSETTRDALQQAIEERLPGIAENLDLAGIATAREAAGIIGLLGLLYAGLGALDALRTALREMSMTTTPPLGFLAGKLRDLAALIMIGVTAIASVLVAGFATTATDKVLHYLFGASPLAGLGLRTAGVVASVGADWLLFVILLGWVARSAQPFREIAKGALLGAIGFGVLKQVATLLLASTLGNSALYGTFAVIVGLLVWINFSARLVLLVAAWTATAGLSPPPSPTPIPGAGSGEPEAAPREPGAEPGEPRAAPHELGAAPREAGAAPREAGRPSEA
ncbi:YihY/virulence factor BrkB family protein [Nonomuraea fuscirosea]|uniref:YihY/virulence factor BrkB family protein n=1 Tax=Nonomuraea fuscirosea TaxID=1291556 RepID=UPI0033E62BC2